LSFSTIRPPPLSTLFPYTTLFRSIQIVVQGNAIVSKVNPHFSVAINLVFGNRKHRIHLHHDTASKIRDCVEGYFRKTSNFFSEEDRKSTRLNSSHVKISYAVFCLK